MVTRKPFFALAAVCTEAVRAVRSAVAETAPGIAAYEMSSIEASIEGAMAEVSAALRVLGALAALALTLTLVGVYGVVAHSVGRRRREMGLRMALGSDAGAVMVLVLRGSTRIAAIGVGLGLLISLGAGRVLAFVFEGVEPRDPWALGLVTLSLFLAVGVASYLPARRAASVDPVRTLRGE